VTQPDFLIIPIQILSDTELQPLDQKVFGYVYWLHKLRDGTCTANNETLGELCNALPRSIGRSLGRLEERGYIRRIYDDEISHHRTRIDCLIFYGQPSPSVGRRGLRPVGRQNKSIKNKSIKTLVPSELGAEAPERQDKRDPEVQEVIEKFETVMQLRLPRMPYQRRAAKTLISRETLDHTLRAIEAVAQCRDEPYAPKILSLEDLRDKWNKLLEHYRKKQNNPNVVVIK
jgi:hypothetical protein